MFTFIYLSLLDTNRGVSMLYIRVNIDCINKFICYFFADKTKNIIERTFLGTLLLKSYCFRGVIIKKESIHINKYKIIDQYKTIKNMSHNNFFKPVQKIAHNYVYDSENPTNPTNEQNYTEVQEDIIRAQEQDTLGTIPEYVNKNPHNDIIGSLRYGSGITQSNQIRQQNKPPDRYHQYDSYNDYLRKIGSFNDNCKTRINTRTYSISSSARTLQPQIVTTNRTALPKNALKFSTVTESIGVSVTTQDILTIYCPSHSVQKGEQITLSGATSQTYSIKSIYNDINGEKQNAVIFTNYSTSVVFKCNFDTIIKDSLTGLPTSKIDKSMSFDPNFKIGTGIDHDELKNYDTSNMFTTLSGFGISSTGTPFAGNIAMNFLNSTHRIYFTNPDYKIVNGITVYSPDTLINIPDSNNKVSKITGFYIKLQVPFISTGTSIMNGTTELINTSNMANIIVNTGTPMIINMSFNYIGGIPLNEINAHYPVDENNVKGSHEVYSVSPDIINVIVNKKTYYKNPTLSGLSQNEVAFGGSELELSILNNVLRGYSNQNNYTIELPNAINNVVMAKLTSSVIPNTAKVFTNISGSQNNKLYWQNQDDGDFIYSIEVDPGNYSPVELQKILQEKIYSVPKKYSKSSSQTTSYTDKTYMSVEIDVSTSNVIFTGFKEAVLKKPIQDISPPILLLGDGVDSYILTLSQNNHGLLVGDTVTFASFVATDGIPAATLNVTHVVKSVPNSNTYTVEVSNFNLLSGTRSKTGGGFSARVLVPSPFRLLFNYSDTIGKELGFRKVGQDIAITKFSSRVTNYEPYENEVTTIDNNGNYYISDPSGNTTLLTANSLKLDGHDYILMIIRKFDNIINISGNKKIGSFFAKMNLRGLPGTMSYDDFISPPLIFYEPIELSKLDITFCSPDGELYDFDGIDHNFTLEITNIEYMPDSTGIVSTLSMF